MLQELKLMTTSHVATPSALWRHQAAGPTSLAWDRAPTALQLLRRGQKKTWHRMVVFESFVGFVTSSSPSCSRPRPSSPHQLPYLPSVSEDRSPQSLNPRGLSQKHKKKKSSASYDKKEKEKANPNSPYFSTFDCIVFFTIYSLCHQFFQC